MRLLSLLLVALGFAVAPLVFDERVATWSDAVPRAWLRTTASAREEASARAVDEAGQTLWFGLWSEGDWLRIDFDRVLPITHVTVDYGQIQTNHPRLLEVQAVLDDHTRRRDAFENKGRRFRMWQELRAPEPVSAVGVIVRPSLNVVDAPSSGRFDVRDVRLRSSLERELDVGAWWRAIREAWLPLALALVLTYFAVGGRAAREGG